MEEKPRKMGISVIDATPWGTHLCLFYDTKQDLVDILVPYFKAGLENNEFCMWVTAEPLNEEEAREAMRKAVPEFDQCLERGQIEIVPHTEWYLKDGAFNPQRVLNAWGDKLQQALSRGYDGLRLTGNTTWLTQKDWQKFASYEAEVNNVIGKSHMLAICTYPRGKCGAGEAVDVVSNHQSALIKRAGDWTLIKSSESKHLKHDLNERMKELRCIYSVANIVEAPDITLDKLCQKTVNLLPEGWQYPEITCARITIAGREFKTKNWRDTEWKQSSDIKVHRTKVGTVEVNYLEARPEIDEGPFLKEERLLLDAVAERLGRVTERVHAQQESQETSLKATVTRRLTSLQERFIRSGFEGFSDRDVVELLLSLCLPHRECRKLAEECVEQFKNLRGLLTASPQELERAGLTPSCLFCIKLLHELPAEVLKEEILEQTVHSSSREVFDYLYYSMRDLKNEVFKVIYLNNRNQIIDVIDLFEGTSDSIPIRPREIVESAIERSAPALIFVHNHPSGDPTPSRTDKQLTRDLAFVGMILQIKVLDHIIIGGNRYFSFADEGLIQKYEDNFLNLKIRGVFDSGVNYSKGLNKVPALHHNR